MPIDKSKLKNCPFCDSDSDLQTGYIHPNYVISCYRCGVKMSHDRKDKVIGFWNNRPNFSTKYIDQD